VLHTVIIESPYAANAYTSQEAHTRYAIRCMQDCFARGEAPYASHLSYPALLNDAVPHERAIALAASLAIGEKLDATAVYLDYGLSDGMRRGILARWGHHPIYLRNIGMNNDVLHQTRSRVADEDDIRKMFEQKKSDSLKA